MDLRSRRRPRNDAVQRRQRILVLLDARLNQTEIADRLGCSRMTVVRAVRHFRRILADLRTAEESE